MMSVVTSEAEMSACLWGIHRSTNSEFPLDHGEASKARYGMQTMDQSLRVAAGSLA
jgi:hypothetical protein